MSIRRRAARYLSVLNDRTPLLIVWPSLVRPSTYHKYELPRRRIVPAGGAVLVSVVAIVNSGVPDESVSVSRYVLAPSTGRHEKTTAAASTA
jgi:hypothetical protein